MSFLRALLRRWLSAQVTFRPGWPKDYRTQAQIDADWQRLYDAKVAKNIAQRKAYRAALEPDFIPDWMRA